MSGEMFDKIKCLVHKYLPLPPQGFDPLKASDRQLAQYGLPERPARGTDPELFAFWQLMLGSAEVVEPIFPWDPAFARVLIVQGQGPLPRQRFNHRETSKNWSGAYITPIPRPNRFFCAMGAWAVPTASMPQIPPRGVSSNRDYRSSTWIGIGGQRSYNSMPQIGTSQNITMDQGIPCVTTGAWWQWWIKGRKPNDAPIPIDFEVADGDEILAWLTVEPPTPGDVRFNLKNQRTKKIIAFKVRAPAQILPLGSSVEWVHERPTDQDRIYPLAKCTPVSFRHCLAENAACFGGAMTLQKLDKNARLIRMCEPFASPQRSALVSIPQKKGPGVQIEYHEPSD
jgi:Peptidase A4 family